MQQKMSKRAFENHSHRAVCTKTVGWTTCVDPKRCPTPATHGCVVEIEKCACGLYRETEQNATRRFRGRWVDKPRNWGKF